MGYYVVHPDGSKYGPATLSTLQQWVEQNRITQTTLIEDEDTGASVQASLMPGLNFGADASNPQGAPPVQPASTPPSPYAAGSYYSRVQGETQRVNVDNHLVKAILATLFCCLPIGVVAIVFAAQVDGHARRGDTASAAECSRNADTWANWSIGLGILPMLFWLIAMVSMVVAGASHR